MALARECDLHLPKFAVEFRILRGVGQRVVIPPIPDGVGNRVFDGIAVVERLPAALPRDCRVLQSHIGQRGGNRNWR